METSEDIKILLVDDTLANLVTLEAVLTPLQYDTVRARSGSEALEILQTTDISLVILDVQMPGLDGFETAKLIKKKFPEKNIPIIFMTAIYTEDPYIHKGYEVGGVDYFGKPFDPEILKAKVRLHAEMCRQAKLLREMDQKLKELDHRQKLLLDSIPDILCMTSLDGTMVYLNQAFIDRTGQEREKWIGKKFTSIVPPDDTIDVAKGIAEAASEKKVHIFETGILEGSGRYLPVELRTLPFVPDGGTQGAICVAHPIPGKKAHR